MTKTIEEVPELCDELLDKNQKTIRTGSQRKIWWKCSKYSNHIWQATPANRVRTFYCPYCSGRKVLKGFNDLSSTHLSLSKELVEFSDAYSVSKGSDKKLLWKCLKYDHTFEMSVSNRVAGKKCSYCYGNYKVLYGFNDLETLFPSIASELVGDPKRVHSRSNKKHIWRCKSGHEWEASVSNRTRSELSACPKCSLSNSSNLEVGIFNRLFELGFQVELGVSIPGIKGKVDILYKNFAIEFDGKYWHKDSVDRDTRKTSQLISNGLKVIRIRDLGLSTLNIKSNMYTEILLEKSPYKNVGFTQLINSLIAFIEE